MTRKVFAALAGLCLILQFAQLALAIQNNNHYLNYNNQGRVPRGLVSSLLDPKNLYLYEIRSGLPYGANNGTAATLIFTESTATNLGRLEALATALREPFLLTTLPRQFATLDDYEGLYASWSASPVFGVPIGMGGKWKLDSFFAKQALSTQSWSLRRVASTASALPLPLSDADIAGLLPSGRTLQGELQAGRLYISDFSNLDAIPNAPGRYVGGSLALYGLDANDALIPLAIQLSTGGLVFTPADGAGWTLAKLNHNSAHMYVVQYVHFLRDHLVWETVWTAAHRNLPDYHPISKVVLHHTENCFIFSPLASLILTPAGTDFDSIFAKGGSPEFPAMATYYSTQYNFRDLYFETDIAARGLNDIPTMPGRDQRRKLNNAIRTLMWAIVNSTYSSDAKVAADAPFQGFVAELATRLNGFPSAITTKAAVVDFLTHMADSISIEHPLMNVRNPYKYSALPYSPGALWQPLPTQKCQVTEDNIINWMPNFTIAYKHLTLATEFHIPVDDAHKIGPSYSQLGLSSSVNPAIADFQATLASLKVEFQAEADAEDVLPFILWDPDWLPYWGWV